MDYTTLGRTGLTVSRAGFGGGGGARMGCADGRTDQEAARLPLLAYELGINVFDTAEDYGSERAMGLAIKDMQRDNVVVSTKHYVVKRGNRYTTREIVAGLEHSLRQMNLDYVDIFFIHGLTLRSYDQAIDEVIPALKNEQAKGKFRFFGATEAPPQDLHHDMAARAMDDDWMDVLMPAFSVLNQNARRYVFPKSIHHDVGSYIMFAVRNMFSYPDHTWETLRRLADEGKLPTSIAEERSSLDFLIRPEGARDLLDVAYRFARDEPGADVVLFGTGSETHLRHNVESLAGPPLPEVDRQKLIGLFGALEGVGLEPSVRPKPN